MIKKLDNLKLVNKFNAIIFIIMLTSAILLTIGLYKIKSSNNEMQLKVSHALNISNINEEVHKNINTLSNNLAMEFIQLVEEENFEGAKLKVIDEYKKFVVDTTDELRNYIDYSEMQEVTNSMNNIMIKLEEIEQNLQEGDVEEALTNFLQVEKNMDSYLTFLSILRKQNANILKEDIFLYDIKITNIIITSCILLIVVFVISAFLLKKLNDKVDQKVRQVVHFSDKIALGDFDVSIPNLGKDEFGEIAENMIRIKESISGYSDTLKKVGGRLLNGNNDIKINKEGYHGEYLELFNILEEVLQFNRDENQKFITTLNEINKGNFEYEIEDGKNDNKIITDTFKNLQKSLLQTKESMLSIINNVKQGNLKFKLDEEKYEGGWKELISGLNEVTDNIQKPINDVFELIESFEKGNLQYEIKNEYEGIFKKLTYELNKINVNTKLYIDNIDKLTMTILKNDYSAKLNKAYFKGDFIAIYNSLTMLVDGINKILATIASTSNDMSDISVILKEFINKTHGGIEQQIDSISEVKNSLTITEKGVLNSSNLAKETTNFTEIAIKEVEECNNQMNVMLDAMNEINGVTDKISNIIATINDIAFQTNLLSLNASVEAARAGQHGKGFAVVAEEVGNLATRSQRAAEETGILINETINKVKTGSQMANEAAITLDKVIKDIGDINVNIDNISGELGQQTGRVEGLNVSIDFVSNIAKNNIQFFEKLNKSANNLEEKSILLKSFSNDFKLKKDVKKIDLVSKKPNKVISLPITNQKEVNEDIKKAEEKPKIKFKDDKIEKKKIKPKTDKKAVQKTKIKTQDKPVQKIKEKSITNKSATSDVDGFSKERVILEKEFNRKDMGKY